MQTEQKVKTTLAALLSFLFILSGISFAEDLGKKENYNNFYAYERNDDNPDRRFNKKNKHGEREEVNQRDHRPPHHKGLHFSDPQFLKEKLNLSDDQITKIGKINLKFKKAHLDIREKLEPKKIQLEKLLLDDNINLKKVKSKLKEIEEYDTERAFLQIKHRVEIEKVLTKKQKDKLKNEQKFKRKHRRPRDK